MKNIIFLIASMTLGFQAQANSSKKTCERLYKQAEENCRESICEQYTEENPGKECVIDGDFNEGLQICVSESELPDLIKAYNKKHPRKKINCDDI